MNRNTKILIVLGLAAGAWYFIDRQKKQQELELELEKLQARYKNQPPANSNDWYNWISLILKLAGQTAALWEPGGPFYKSNVPNPDSKEWLEILGRIQWKP